MEFDDVAEAVDGVPHITRERGRILYDTIVRERPSAVVELGFAHGVSTCYVAAALDHIGGDGRITTLDSTLALERRPPLAEMLERTGLGHRVEAIHAERSYTWELRRFLRQERTFDFAFIDGAHTWDVDGFAFCLLDRMLHPGSWVLFDDIDWTIASSATLSAKPEMAALPAEERETAQVREVYELLVRGDLDYGDFRTDAHWAWARKRPDAAPVGGVAARVDRLAAAEARVAELEASTTWKVGRAVTAVPRTLKQTLRRR